MVREGGSSKDSGVLKEGTFRNTHKKIFSEFFFLANKTIQLKR